VLPSLVVDCAVTPSREALQLPAAALTVVGTPPVIDKRADFRAVFCAALVREDSHLREQKCDDYLWHLPDEKADIPPPRSEDVIDPRLRVLIVGGAFGDCYPPESTAFADTVQHLKSQGLDVGYVAVEGLSTAYANSRLIAAAVAAVPRRADHPLILVGYSKGTADILEALVQDSDIASRVSAVVSIAGAVNGSPLASRYLGVEDSLFSRWLLRECRGNGGVLTSLTTFDRLSWLADNSIPPKIHYYSIATFTTPPRLARILAYPQRQLSKVDPRNDGQLLAQDQLIPGSALLGYANADHWAIALRMEDRFPFLAHREAGRHPFPQQALLEAILLYLQRDLGLSGAAQR
jgi:hypothetical protein